MSDEFLESLVDDAEALGRPMLSSDTFPVYGDGIIRGAYANLDDYDDDPDQDDGYGPIYTV